jgi:hypothetical protein
MPSLMFDESIKISFSDTENTPHSMTAFFHTN